MCLGGGLRNCGDEFDPVMWRLRLAGAEGLAFWRVRRALKEVDLGAAIVGAGRGVLAVW